MAEAVMRMPDSMADISTGIVLRPANVVHRLCQGCEEEELHRKESESADRGAETDVESELASLSTGRPLGAAERAFFEPRFGRDFSTVRIYTDPQTARLAESVSAHAFTFGNQIVFNSEQYSPESKKGQHLLAHELTHVVQQGQAQRMAKNDISVPSLDEESGSSADVVSPFLIQRQRVRNALIGAGVGALVGGGIGALVGGGIGALTGSSAPDCPKPLSMSKVVSGAFQGGFTMDSYHPDLVGLGYYTHPGTAGTFDTGTRAGANVQLYGTIPTSCTASSFSLAQTVTYKKKVINGVHDPKEGVVQDDIGKSGRDASRAPFRQEWAGGGGYNISMADPPSISYGPGDNIEHDRDFVTSLVGPSGRALVSWSTSIRVVNGTVTQNTIS